MNEILVSPSEEKLVNDLLDKKSEESKSDGTDDILDEVRTTKPIEIQSKLIPQSLDSETENEEKIDDKNSADLSIISSIEEAKPFFKKQHKFEFFGNLIQNIGINEFTKRASYSILGFGGFCIGIYYINKIPNFVEKYLPAK